MSDKNNIKDLFKKLDAQEAAPKKKRRRRNKKSHGSPI